MRPSRAIFREPIALPESINLDSYVRAWGEANFSDHGANRLGASALMQGMADGYFVIDETKLGFGFRGERSDDAWLIEDGYVTEGTSNNAYYVKDGKIILNISDSAAHNLKLTNETCSFRARFSGVPFDVVVPMRSVLGIYARETGQGMIFSHDAENSDPVAEAPQPTEETRSRPHLKIVK